MEEDAGEMRVGARTDGGHKDRAVENNGEPSDSAAEFTGRTRSTPMATDNKTTAIRATDTSNGQACLPVASNLRKRPPSGLPLKCDRYNAMMAKTEGEEVKVAVEHYAMFMESCESIHRVRSHDHGQAQARVRVCWNPRYESGLPWSPEHARLRAGIGFGVKTQVAST
jgi:hypothetical protein